ncbi:MAG: hypothetical protein A4S09_13510 [Proteobacteria bacterium SG_bin7]|nr:MAG: hypothetical protein A4S09_13510 [Proteobacteria bacterium SG_bin7]
MKFSNLLFYLVLAWPALSLAGGISDGGGNGVVCFMETVSFPSKKDDGYKMISAELLDLYEGKIEFGLTPKESDADPMKQAEARLTQLKNALGPKGGALDSEWRELQQNLVFLPKGTKILPVEDSNHVVVPPAGCQIIQLARYRKDGRIYINSDVWDKLSNTHRAALLVHETLYSYLRFREEDNSDRTRIAVAHLFADMPFEPIDSGVQHSSESYICSSRTSEGFNPKYKFWLYPRKNTDFVTAQFEFLDKKVALSKTVADFALKLPLHKYVQNSIARVKSNVDGSKYVIWVEKDRNESENFQIKIDEATTIGSGPNANEAVYCEGESETWKLKEVQCDGRKVEIPAGIGIGRIAIQLKMSSYPTRTFHQSMTFIDTRAQCQIEFEGNNQIDRIDEEWAENIFTYKTGKGIEDASEKCGIHTDNQYKFPFKVTARLSRERDTLTIAGSGMFAPGACGTGSTRVGIYKRQY